MKLESFYQKIISEINQGHRGLVRLNDDELEDLNSELVASLNSPEELEKVLCVVEHSSSLYIKFEKNILTVLNADIPDPLIIFALNCARKHIVEARFQKGMRLDFEFLETLKKLLHHSNPEVVEWTLRLIEGCGNQGIYFLKEFDKIKPPPWKWFNAHQRAVREIIALLERRWSPFEKS
ncbi:MAG: hypothetical protein ACLGHN_07665 [Bacteriovoracia bacterium]